MLCIHMLHLYILHSLRCTLLYCRHVWSSTENRKKRKHEGESSSSSSTHKEHRQPITAAAVGKAEGDEDNDQEEIKILAGTGRITSSGTTVQGHATEFMNELSNGDAIMVTHPTS